MSHYVTKDKKDWETWLPYVLFADNTASHYTGNEHILLLLHGEDPDMAYETADNYSAELMSRLQAPYEHARKTLDASAKIGESYYDHRNQTVQKTNR